MNYLVSITSQGQISIPAKIRRKLGLYEFDKAYVKEEGGRVIVEPVADLLKLKGILKHKAIKGKSIDTISKITGQNVLNLIGGNVAPARLKCAFLALEAVKKLKT